MPQNPCKKCKGSGINFGGWMCTACTGFGCASCKSMHDELDALLAAATKLAIAAQAVINNEFLGEGGKTIDVIANLRKALSGPRVAALLAEARKGRGETR